jgi:hypothetical protein
MRKQCFVLIANGYIGLVFWLRLYTIVIQNDSCNAISFLAVLCCDGNLLL